MQNIWRSGLERSSRAWKSSVEGVSTLLRGEAVPDTRESETRRGGGTGAPNAMLDGPNWVVIDEAGTSHGNALGIRLFGPLREEEQARLWAQMRHLVVMFGRVRLLVEVDPSYTDFSVPAMLHELKPVWDFSGGITHIALVHDNTWVRILSAFDSSLTLFSPGIVERSFRRNQRDEAWAWLRDGHAVFQRAVDPLVLKQPVRTSSELRVLILGGGVSGLTLAALLQSRGFQRVTVAEKLARPPATWGWRLMLFPSALDVLKSLSGGLLARVEADSHVCSEWTFVDAKSGDARPVRLAALEDRYGPVRAIEKSTLETHLRSLVSESIRLDLSLSSIDLSNEEVVVRFDNGQIASYDVVVGADGRHSRVRSLVFAPGEVPLSTPSNSSSNAAHSGSNAASSQSGGGHGEAAASSASHHHSAGGDSSYGNSAAGYGGGSGPSGSHGGGGNSREGVRLWAFAVEKNAVRVDSPTEIVGTGGRSVALVPMGLSVAVLCSVTGPLDHVTALETRRSRIVEVFRDFGAPVPEALNAMPSLDRIHSDVLLDRSLEDWHRARIVLLGEAVHPLLPSIDLSATLSIESAAVLAEELTRSDSRYISRALANYGMRRARRFDLIRSLQKSLSSRPSSVFQNVFSWMQLANADASTRLKFYMDWMENPL